jgi:phosphoenolpyruvate carboxylase
MGKLASLSRHAYSTLLTTDGFLHFFRQATPIDVIEAGRIGSRPPRRTGQGSLADLRAIPWVFSWNQARFVISGWYGAGSALEILKEHDAATFEALCAQTFTWPPLQYIITNISTSLLTADIDIMRAYAELVGDGALRESILGMVLAEFDRTQRMIEGVFGGPLAERRQRLARLLALWRHGLSVLHGQQIGLLRSWRNLRASGDTEAAEQVLLQLLLTVNAIAAGLRTTG